MNSLNLITLVKHIPQIGVLLLEPIILAFQDRVQVGHDFLLDSVDFVPVEFEVLLQSLQLQTLSLDFDRLEIAGQSDFRGTVAEELLTEEEGLHQEGGQSVDLLVVVLQLAHPHQEVFVGIEAHLVFQGLQDSGLHGNHFLMRDRVVYPRNQMGHREVVGLVHFGRNQLNRYKNLGDVLKGEVGAGGKMVVEEGLEVHRLLRFSVLFLPQDEEIDDFFALRERKGLVLPPVLFQSRFPLVFLVEGENEWSQFGDEIGLALVLLVNGVEDGSVVVIHFRL